jgi:hypothetical protein
MGRRAGLDDVKGEKSCPYLNSNSGSSVMQPQQIRYNDCVIQFAANRNLIFCGLKYLRN